MSGKTVAGGQELSLKRCLIAGLLCLMESGCFTPSETVLRGDKSYGEFPPALDGYALGPYRIGPEDKLSIRVFQEPDLSFDEIQVDASGVIVFPLLQQIVAAGKTPQELGDEIKRSLASHYIRSPQVYVGISQSASRHVTVEGSVTQPGVYDLAGQSSLLEAIARARGLTRVAVVNQVLVFRQVQGHRVGAMFDLRGIREGRVPDPQILGGDKIVVGFSALKGAYRDFLSTAPLINVFTRF